MSKNLLKPKNFEQSDRDNFELFVLNSELYQIIFLLSILKLDTKPWLKKTAYLHKDDETASSYRKTELFTTS